MKPHAENSSDARLTPIRPEILASKLAAIRNYEHPALLKQISECPRLVELLWFLQAMSLRPGGLVKFTEELLNAFPHRVGTKTMVAAQGKNYTLAQKLAIRSEIPSKYCPDLPSETSALTEILCALNPAEISTMRAQERRHIEAALNSCDAGFFRNVCQSAAMDNLPFFLRAICTEPGKGFNSEPSKAHQLAGAHCETWFFENIIGSLFELMDRRAAQVQKRLAMTEVARQVFDALDFALAEKVMVRIEGASRFGKTEAMETWCDMRPGLSRLVRVPCSNSMNDFFKRIGEALGIDCSYGTNPSRLRERIEYVIQHSGLFLVLDEGAFLIPQNYTATTPPHRLNWVRTEIVDRHLPLALAVTPQAFESAVRRFVKKTSYTMEQYFGRNFLTRVLPSTLGENDMIAVAQIHFPELDEDALGYIANEARLSQNYLQAVEAIARRSRFLARNHKGRVTLKIIQTAVAEVLPRCRAITGQAGDPDQVTLDRERASGASERALRPVNAPLAGHSRAIAAVRSGEVSETFFDRRSLRGAGPERTEAELVEA